ncbi:MAG TPA: galactose oxidase-like domain-containing protein [Steroidobacteraceae bacterium]|nr:galactose oxidase-like domain-containing protein [Steroidobacteraceae bacterium]
MPHGYLPIPDWFSFENQGGNIAAADLSGTGKSDLVVFMVDNAAGQNRGVFRIARDLDATGNPLGGWTPWFDVPDWFSSENQGTGIAVGDIDRDGKQDIVVFMIDNPAGQNGGFYRVGKAIDVNGNVAGGWGPWITIPDWFSFENQHGAITLADLDGDGNPELIVLMVDNPPGNNRGLYRIGRKLDANANVTGGWTPWLEVPDWFSWETQGVGIAVADLNNNGRHDLLVFQIDAAVDQNQAFYKFGRDLDINGNVAGDWSLWRGVPSWFAWENQGGGIAAIRHNGLLQMIVMMVDNPPEQNAGYYRLLPLEDNPARDGKWELLGFKSGVLAVHAALLRTGKVLFFAGSGSSATRFASADFGNMGKGIFTSVVWDPQAAPPNNFSHPPTIFAADHRPFDFFCGGDTFLPDGRVLSAGGTTGYNPFRGRADATVFDPQTETWKFVAGMTHGRWYPSLIALGDGRVLAATGLTEAPTNPHNQTLEIYSAATNHWNLLHFAPGVPALPLYAHLFLLADGRVFFNGGHMDDVLLLDPCTIDLAHNPVQTRPIFGITARDMRNQSASVLLPPAQSQRVMLIGGGPDGKPNKTDAVDNVDIVDFNAANPQFVPAAPLCLPRLHLNAVLLPDRTVFVTGGSLKQEEAPLARLQSEIYDPTKDEWTLTAACTVPRLYHSTALLLPDARVVTAGGNPEGGKHVPWGEDPNEEMHIEIFSPPYLFRGPRPTIVNAPVECKYGTTLSIQSPNAGALRFVSLVRNCITTHSYDTNQRLVDAKITSQQNGVVKVELTDNPNLAPTGWYMLFLVSNTGVPSVAHWIHLT